MNRVFGRPSRLPRKCPVVGGWLRGTQISADATVPRVTLAKADIPVSRMFEGVFAATIATLEYRNHADLELQLFRRLPDLAARVIQSAKRRRPVLAGFSELRLGTVILKQRIVHNVTVEHLAEQADITSSWLRKLERNHMLAACCTAIQLNRMAAATHCYVKTVDVRNLTTLAPSDDDLSATSRSHLTTLWPISARRDHKLGDDRVFRLWNSYRVRKPQEPRLRPWHTAKARTMPCQSMNGAIAINARIFFKGRRHD